MDSDSPTDLGISEMLDEIMEKRKSLTRQKGKEAENPITEENKLGPPKTVIADQRNYFPIQPNFVPVNYHGNRVTPYGNFPKPIEQNTNVPPIGFSPRTHAQNMNFPSHSPNVIQPELKDAEKGGGLYNFQSPYMPPQIPNFQPGNQNLFPVPPPLPPENNVNTPPFSFPPPPRPSNSFYFNLPGVLPTSSDNIQPRTTNVNLQSDKKRKKKKKHTPSSSPTVLPLSLPPPPSPPNLISKATCPTSVYQHGPLTPPPSHHSPPPLPKDSISHNFSNPPPLPPSPIHLAPPLPSSPPPPPDHPMNRPPEPSDPPPKSPIDDYDSYSLSSPKSSKKENKRSSKTKTSKSASGDQESLDVKPLNNDHFSANRKRKTSETYDNLKRNDSKIYPGANLSPNVFSKREKYFSHEPPPYNLVGVPPCNIRGPSFNPMSGRPPFPPGERPHFTPIRGKPFNPMERPPFIGRGRSPHFNMYRCPPPYRPLRPGPPPFHAMGGGRPPFHPMGAGLPPFQTMQAGVPCFPPQEERFPFHSLAKLPPFDLPESSEFDAMGEGPPPFDSMGYDDNFEYEEFSGQDDPMSTQYESKQKYTKSKHKLKLLKHSKDKDGKLLKSSRMTKPLVKSRKSEIDIGKKNVKVNMKKKLVDYELEPGEYISDMESVDSDSTKSEDSESDSVLNGKNKLDTKASLSPLNISHNTSEKSSWKPSKFDSYLKSKPFISDSDSSETFCESPKSEKPKYPRYFKDKVAFISDIPKIFVDENDLISKIVKEFPLTLKKKTDTSDEIKKPLSPPISSESLKAAKTPLIKRLGLSENITVNSVCPKNESEKDEDKTFGHAKMDRRGNPSNLLGINTEHGHSISYNSSEKDDAGSFKSLHLPFNVDHLNRQNRSNSLSPSDSLDSEEGRLLASTKEILSASKSIFKSPTSPKITTTKKQYEKPIIKVETASKPDPITKQVEESPHRIDLDSRIKIMFGMKSSGEEDSPEKRNLRSAALSHKNMRLLSRPPSPFRSKNAYQFWHRETYYFRKHNPVPKEFSDPTAKRKIGIQIKAINDDDLQDSKQDELPIPLPPSECAMPSESSTQQVSKSASQEHSMELQKDESLVIEAVINEDEQSNHNEDCLDSTEVNSSTKIGNEITKVDVLPNAEMEIISEELDPTQIEDATISDSVECSVSEVSNNDVVNLVISKIIEELKCTIKLKLTEDLIQEKLEL